MVEVSQKIISQLVDVSFVAFWVIVIEHNEQKVPKTDRDCLTNYALCFALIQELFQQKILCDMSC